MKPPNVGELLVNRYRKVGSLTIYGHKVLRDEHLVPLSAQELQLINELVIRNLTCIEICSLLWEGYCHPNASRMAIFRLRNKKIKVITHTDSKGIATYELDPNQ